MENPYLPPQVTETAAPAIVDQDGEELRDELLGREAQLRMLGLIYWLGSLALMAMSISAIVESPSHKIGANQLLGAALMGSLILLFAAIGFGLWKYHKWARILGFVASIPSLIIFPIGTLLGGFSLIILSAPENSRIFSRHYRNIVSVTPHLKPKASRRFLIVYWTLILISISVTAAFVVSIYSHRL